MIVSRSLDDLLSPVKQLAQDFIGACADQNIDLLVTATYRDNEAQAALYAQGRTKPGHIVTNASAGQSFHNWRVAFDVVPIISGKAIWDDASLWSQIGMIGEGVGLEWGGKWTSFKDIPHFQHTGGFTVDDFRRLSCVAL